jgi:hypothetical protein
MYLNYVVQFFLLIILNVVVLNVSAQDKKPSNGLLMSGWDLAADPKVGNSNQETGSVSYAIEIDSLGNLLAVTVLKKEVSDELVQKCEAEIRKMDFVKNVNNTSGAPHTKEQLLFFQQKDWSG